MTGQGGDQADLKGFERRCFNEKGIVKFRMGIDDGFGERFKGDIELFEECLVNVVYFIMDPEIWTVC